jgi:DNA-damage-inducible protein J
MDRFVPRGGECCDECGDIRIMLTRIAREKALPFEPLVPNATTIAAMKEARKGGLKSFSTAQDLMADLNADD